MAIKRKENQLVLRPATFRLSVQTGPTFMAGYRPLGEVTSEDFALDYEKINAKQFTTTNMAGIHRISSNL